jgi:hypothetical protein
MKTMLVALPIALSSLHAFGQGQVVFANNTPSLRTHIYAPLLSNPFLALIGNGSADRPGGTQDWSGFALVGAVGIGGQYGGASTVAQLLGANGFNQPEAALQLASPTTTFRTGSNAGLLYATTATFDNIPWDNPATIELVAWDNSSGLYTTWAEAEPAWAAGWIAAGKSGTFNVQLTTPTQLPPMLTGLESFNLYLIPEPSLAALAGLSALLLLAQLPEARRRP